MDIQQVAMNALVSKLVKSKLLPRPQLAVSLDAERAKDFPIYETAQKLGLDPTKKGEYDSVREERVVHQVQSAKVLAEELTSCIKSVAALVFPPAPKETTSNVVETSNATQDTESAIPAQPAKKAKTKQVPTSVQEDDYSSDDGFGDEDTDRVPNQQWDLSDMDKLDALVGSGSDDSDGDEEDGTSDDEDNSSDVGPSMRAKRPRSESDEDEDEDEDENEDFLPSLATGFIPAGAGDDWNDAEADFADQDASGKGPAKSMRKNRRGQRERRAYVSHY